MLYALIPFLPLLAFVILGLFGHWIKDRSHWVAVPAVLGSFLLSIMALVDVAGGQTLQIPLYTWADSGNLHIAIGLFVDQLTVAMLLLVTIVSSLVHVYTIGYMHGEPGYARFFSNIALFTFSMLMLVMSDNFLQLFVFWEAVGLCSYLLIGHWYERESARAAATKAFLVNRVGDFGFMLGILLVFVTFGSLHYQEVFPQLEEKAGGLVNLLGSVGGHWEISVMTLICLLLFVGAVGKSAQVPLHVWLPDAMEGPTPISALIHAATMVTAGVFMVARFAPLFNLSPVAMDVVAVVGGVTMFVGATIALTQTDIKRVVAYSTLSQLGYMMMALGVGAWLAGVMHLITHAFFKSLLFMCSGSVIHAVHTNEMPEMGGLRRKMPVTAYTMLVGCMAIAGAGIPFILGFLGQPLVGLGLSGFYSKDQILEQAFSFMNVNSSAAASVFFLAAAGGAAITAFYMFRLWYLTFAGEPRDQERYDHAHESPATMFVPLVILSVMAVAVAWNWLQGILGGAVIGIVFLLLRRRAANSPGEAHGHSEPHHDAAEDHGSDDRGHSTLPPWLPDLPWMLGFGVLAVALVCVALTPGSFGERLATGMLPNLLEQARPAGTLAGAQGVLLENWTWPNEHDAHNPPTVVPVSLIAIGTALAGFCLATLMYGLRRLDPAEVRRQFAPIYRFLLNKWWFDELYDWLFVRPTHVIAGWASKFDRSWIDWAIDGLASFTKAFAKAWDRIADQTLVDGVVNFMARKTYATGLALRVVQTGRIRQYVMFIVIGSVAIFILISFFWNPTSLAR